MTLWTAAEAVAATGGEAQGGWEAVSGVSIDSRTLARGDLFVALEGLARDGHAFVAQALAAGAGAAMVTHRPEGVAEDAPLLVVDDTLRALERLAAAARARSAAKVLAVTGSVGKTSTKEMLRAMLDVQGRVHAAEQSFNNHWGVPLTLARMPADTQYAVLEIGMNHPGEIAPLSRLARPDLALVTTVEAVHLEAFPEGEIGIARAKAEIFEGLPPEGIAVLNADNRWFETLAGAANPHRVLPFGRAGGYARLDEARIAGDSTVMRVTLDGRPLMTKLPVPGLHLAQNACGALAAVAGIGADPARAALALGRWHPPGGRGERMRVLLGPGGLDGEILLIDESYNANPTSVRAALAVLGAAPVTHDIGRVARGRRIAFLGDMLELGPTETALHAGLADLPEMQSIDVVHTCGPRMKALHDALPKLRRGLWFADSRLLAEKARRVVDAGDVCMVKGSKGAAMGRVVEAIAALGNIAPGPQED